MEQREQLAPGTLTAAAPEPCNLRSQLETLRSQLDAMRLMGATIAACTAGPPGDPAPGEDKAPEVPEPEPLADVAANCLRHSAALGASLQRIAHQIIPGAVATVGER